MEINTVKKKQTNKQKKNQKKMTQNSLPYNQKLLKNTKEKIIII